MRRRNGFTLVELLVVIAIIGILIGLLLPAVQQARESARNTQCKNRIRQVGLAAITFEATRKAYPPARLFPGKTSSAPIDLDGDQPSWLVRVLPFLEQENLFDKWDTSASYADHADEIKEAVVETFLCPSRRSADNAYIPSIDKTEKFTSPCGCGGWFTVKVVGGATGDFAGNHGDLSPGSTGAASDYYYGGNGTGVIISSRGKRRADSKIDWIDKVKNSSITDGLSNTALAGELHVGFENLNSIPYNGPIYNGEDLAASTRVGGPSVPLLSGAKTPVSSVLGFGSWHPGVCNFVFADGSTRSIALSVDTYTLGQMCHRADGTVFSLED